MAHPSDTSPGRRPLGELLVARGVVLDALRDDREAERVAQLHDRADHRHVAQVGAHAQHEALVDLHLVHRQLPLEAQPVAQRRAVDALSGQLVVRSEPGHGARFAVDVVAPGREQPYVAPLPDRGGRSTSWSFRGVQTSRFRGIPGGDRRSAPQEQAAHPVEQVLRQLRT